jgi:hypothetical protein
MQGAQGDNRYEARKPDSPQVAQMRSIMWFSPLWSIFISSKLTKSFLNLLKIGIADVHKWAKNLTQFFKLTHVLKAPVACKKGQLSFENA